jgi:hypothetical protein
MGFLKGNFLDLNFKAEVFKNFQGKMQKKIKILNFLPNSKKFPYK